MISACGFCFRSQIWSTHHLESLVGVSSGKVTIGTVDSRLLACVLCSLQDSSYGRLQLVGEFACHWVPDVVSQIPRSDKENVNAVDLGNFFYLLVCTEAKSAKIRKLLTHGVFDLQDLLTTSKASLVSICTIVKR